jgi:hypothetical protein
MCTLEGVNQYLKKGEELKSKQSKAVGYNTNLKPFKLKTIEPISTLRN